jgi:hypothetical protein
MKLDIKHQDSYSRGQLLLRTLFGWLYIGIPHGIVLTIFGIASGVISWVTFFVVLFTGKFPKGFFDFQIKYTNYSLRVFAAFYNLVDGYPAFGINGTSDKVNLTVDYPEKVNQGSVILRFLFGWLYVGIPHIFCLYFRFIAVCIVSFIAWWAILFTGKFPEKMHGFIVGTFRWMTNIQLYMGYFTDQYPKFSGKE